MEVEGTEQNIILQPEGMIVGAVTSVNSQTGDVVLTTSDLENTSDYQTGADVQEAIAGKQDKLTAGNNIQISEQNVISATNTTYSAGNGINISGENAISVDTTVVATQQNLSDEVTNRENADIYLQGQIDAISASSDVVDIVGTYAELQAYDTQHLKDNDIIKVLQDETQGDATTYYRWSTHTQTFTLIGQEGPYYTKAGADAQFVPQTRTVNGKALSANITLNASDVSALGTSDVTQTTGSSTSMVMSQKATTDALGTKLNITDYVVDTQLADSDNPVQNRVLNGLLGNMPSDFFSGSSTTTPTASTEVQFGNILGLDDAQLLGDTFQQTYHGYQLLPTPYVSGESITTRGITFTANPDGTMVLNGKNDGTASAAFYFVDRWGSMPMFELSAGTYYFIPNSEGVEYEMYDGSRYYTLSSNNNFTVTFQSNVSIRQIYIVIRKSNQTQFNNYKLYPMLTTTVNPTVADYEPYTGGPAPNPDYPQNINVVTGAQTVEVTGKNLFDKDNPNTIMAWVGNDNTLNYNSTTTSIWISCKPNTTYTVQKSNSGTGNRFCVWTTADAPANGVTVENFVGTRSGDDDNTSYTITTTNNSKYLGVFFHGSATSASVADIEASIQIEPIQTYTIDLGATELCKIGDYRDYIYKSGDDWYVHKETARVDVSSLGGWFASGSYAYKTRNGMSDILPASSDSATAVGLCNAFSASTTNLVYAGSVDYGFALPGAGGTGILIRNKNVASLADFTTYLSNNSVYGYFALATATDTKITDATLISELGALLNANTYDGETDFVITATGTNLPAPLQLTAVNANAKGIIYKLRA